MRKPPEAETPSGVPLGALTVPDRGSAVNTPIVPRGPSEDTTPLGLSNAHKRRAGELRTGEGAALFHLIGGTTRGYVPPHGRRGTVASFSRQSRKRLMQRFASLNVRRVQYASLFVTLTYPGEWPEDPRVWHNHLRLFLQRLTYYRSGVSVLWRLEFQERGAPHFHLLVLNINYIAIPRIQRWWREIAHAKDVHQGKAATKVERTKSWGRACYYVAKYCAKLQVGGPPIESGRVWGIHNRRCFPASVVAHPLDPEEWAKAKAILTTMLPAATMRPEWYSNGYGGWTMLTPEVVRALLGVIFPHGPPVPVPG